MVSDSAIDDEMYINEMHTQDVFPFQRGSVDSCSNRERSTNGKTQILISCSGMGMLNSTSLTQLDHRLYGLESLPSAVCSGSLGQSLLPKEMLLTRVLTLSQTYFG